MKDFVQLYYSLDNTTATNEKLEALVHFFNTAPDEDKVWVVALFSHRRPSRTVNTTLLRKWCAEFTGIPLWLVEESYHIVGDLAESISLITQETETLNTKSLDQWIRDIAGLKNKEEDQKREFVLKSWQSLDSTARFLFNKLITGGFRVGVSSNLIIKALANYLSTTESEVSLLLSGNWDPFSISWVDLIDTTKNQDLSKPYPFYLAYALDDSPEALGPATDWAAEWKWDGIRCQLIYRNREVYLWSRGNELINESFPEFQILAGEKIDTDFVIDGELVIYHESRVKAFQDLQSRLGRKKPGKSILGKFPAAIICYDLLEINGKDYRSFAYHQRRQELRRLLSKVNIDLLQLSEEIDFSDWASISQIRESSRENGSEGLMFKRKSSPYQAGRKRGDWWKWKVDPMTVDAVMIYAQRGHGRRSNLFTDFTFAVKDKNQLVPFTKAYSGLTDKEFALITDFVKKNTLERYGPVCSVPAVHVFEIAFEGIQKSSRHKCGIALRFPRIKRWRKDKSPDEINTLEDLKLML